MSASRRHEYAAVVVVPLFIAVAFWHFVHVPMARERTSLGDSIARLGEVEAIEKSTESARARLESVRARLESERASAASDASVGAFAATGSMQRIDAVSSIIFRNGAQLKSLGEADSSLRFDGAFDGCALLADCGLDGAAWRRKLVVSATYPALLSILNSIEKDNVPAVVESLSMDEGVAGGAKTWGITICL